MEFLQEQSLRKLSSAMGAALLFTLILFFLMQALIAVEDISLDDTGIRIADVTMPDRDLELLADLERPEEEEPPPETMPPEFDMTPPADLENAAPRPKFDMRGKKEEFLLMDLMCQFLRFHLFIQDGLRKEG